MSKERFRLVIAGDVPNDKAREFLDSIPAMVAGMRAFGIDVDHATTYPGGDTHHTHEDSFPVADEIADPDSREAAGVSLEKYTRLLEDELAKFADGLNENGVVCAPAESVVDAGLRVIKSLADLKARIAALESQIDSASTPASESPDPV